MAGEPPVYLGYMIVGLFVVAVDVKSLMCGFGKYRSQFVSSEDTEVLRNVLHKLRKTDLFPTPLLHTP